MAGCDPTAADSTKMGFVTRWSLIKKNQVMEFYGRMHTDIFNEPVHLLTGVRSQIKFTNVKSRFYLMKKDPESKIVFRFVNAQLWVNRIRPSPTIPVAHNTVLSEGSLA